MAHGVNDSMSFSQVRGAHGIIVFHSSNLNRVGMGYLQREEGGLNKICYGIWSPYIFFVIEIKLKTDLWNY